MMEIQPFDIRPRCPKCRQDRWHWQFMNASRDAEPDDTWPEHLTLACETCGYTFWMQPDDAARR